MSEASTTVKRGPSGALALIEAMRPRQWTKNLIVFSAPLFAFHVDVPTALAALGAFALLCCASSGFYLINDVADLEADRRHPVKRHRAIASGRVSVPLAIALAVALLGVALAGGWLTSAALGVAISAYVVLQVAYNAILKRTVLVDIMAIATGFVLRAYAGAAAADVAVSPWFLTCTALLALFLGIEKRKAELRFLGTDSRTTRAVLGEYSLPLLVRMENTVTAGAVITYTIWASGPQVRGAPTPWMLVTIPFVLYGVFRYQMLSTPDDAPRPDATDRRGVRAERPEEVLLTDPPILINALAWALTSFLVLLLQREGYLS